MSRKGQATRTPWTRAEEATLLRLYPTGGIAACTAALPERTADAIRSRVCVLGLKLTDDARSDMQSAASGRPADHRWEWPEAPPIDAVVHGWIKRRHGEHV